MTRYFFDLRDGETFSIDVEGREFSGIAEAQADAAQILADMASDLASRERQAAGHPMCVEVRDEQGPCFVVIFGFMAERSQTGSTEMPR